MHQRSLPESCRFRQCIRYDYPVTKLLLLPISTLSIAADLVVFVYNGYLRIVHSSRGEKVAL